MCVCRCVVCVQFVKKLLASGIKHTTSPVGLVCHQTRQLCVVCTDFFCVRVCAFCVCVCAVIFLVCVGVVCVCSFFFVYIRVYSFFVCVCAVFCVHNFCLLCMRGVV